MTWPTLRYPLHTIPQDIWDPTLQAWQMAWSGHILLTDPAQLWHANAFYPESWSFAFSDTLLGYAPAGMIGDGPYAAVLRYNIMFVLAHALATVGAYALVRQLGAERIGAAVAAVAYTYAPWLLAQSGHLHIISNGGIPLALAMLARGHGWSLRHGYRPERRHAGWAFAGWLVAAWQLSLGFGVGLVFAYVLALTGLTAVLIWYGRRFFQRLRRPFGWRLLTADFWGAVVFAAVGILMAIPYFKVAEAHPEALRTVEQLRIYSPPVSGFFTAPAESRLWGGLHEQARATLPWAPEMTLLPGFVLYALALAGLVFSIWTVRQRLLLLAGVLVSGVLAMGTRFFDGTWTYLPLFEHLPGWDGLRTPGRLMLWTTLLLGVLAAGAVSAYAEQAREIAAAVRVPPRPGPLLRLVTLLPLLLVLVEGLNTTPHPIVPRQPAALRDVEGPVLVLPSAQEIDENVMLWTTDDFPDLVNGGSGFTPRQLDQVRQVTLSFPDQASIDHLRTLGVRTVVLLRDRVAGTPWQSTVDLPVDTFGIRRQDVGDAVVYRLS
jgi:MFS family permease